jgi:hypothetical protein
MQGHTHTGFFAFLFAGVSAIVFINLCRLAAAWMLENESTATLGKAFGGLVTYE